MNSPAAQTKHSAAEKRLRQRKRSEKLFKYFGAMAVGFGLLALAVLFTSIFSRGIGAFQQTYIQLDIVFDTSILEINDPKNPEQMAIANFDGILRAALSERFPLVTKRKEKRQLKNMLSIAASFELKAQLERNPELINTRKRYWLLVDDDIDSYYKTISSHKPYISRVSKNEIAWVDRLQKSGDIRKQFNTRFFTSGDSAEAEMAGILGALTGSMLTLAITFILSFPIGVSAALYLEEYAPKNRFTDFIEVNINNLAAVPPVIFGLLGLAIFLNIFGMPRSVPLVGGFVLTLMTLPTIIISSRAAIRSIPTSIREAALGMGASKMQLILHHILPLAMPGMLTGTIIGMALALGETAPLLMIGMVAFIAEIPASFTDPATVLPVQIFLWADSPERAFVERTSAAIIVLLAFLITMNGVAVWLRRRMEKRW